MVPLLIVLAALAQTPVQRNLSPPTLQLVPAVVYKAPEGGRQGHEGWTFNVVVQDSAHRKLEALKAEIELFAGATPMERQTLGKEALAKLQRRSYVLPPDAPQASLLRRFSLDEAFDFRFRFSRPAAWGVDRARLRLELGLPGGRKVRRELVLPLARYMPKTLLDFPLHSPAIVTQGPVQDGGHGGYTNQHAVDVIGLDSNYAPQIDDNDENASYTCWHAEVHAPAEGVVAYARNDVPDNPKPGEPLSAAWEKLPDPPLAIAGNCVVLDHGNGECSVFMHMAMGSVLVKIGDRVLRGQVIGRLGSSGDSFGPHLHIQLQAGPELFRSPSLPLAFTNLGGASLTRGTYLTPKRDAAPH